MTAQIMAALDSVAVDVTRKAAITHAPTKEQRIYLLGKMREEAGKMANAEMDEVL